MILSVGMFNQDCEAYFVTYIRVAHSASPKDIFGRLCKSRKVQRELSSQGFNMGKMSEYSYQVDSRERVIRFRDKSDNVSEPGNIAMMYDLHFIK